MNSDFKMTMTTPATLLICGLFKSRFSRVGDADQVMRSLSAFKAIHPKNEVIISSYQGEVPNKFASLVDTVVEVEDPGPDEYRYFPKFIESQGTNRQVNFSRMAITAIEGLKLAQNEIVIKTRIELIPERVTEFIQFFNSTASKLTNPNKIGILLEFYSGLGFSIDGVLGNVPDILQIAKRKTLLDLWTAAQEFWAENVSTLRAHQYPISSDQCLGLNYLSLYFDFNLIQVIPRLRRYYISPQLLKAVKKAETTGLLILSYKTSGFSVNYFKGSHSIKSFYVTSIESTLNFLCVILKLFGKRIKMFIRRYNRALKNRIYRKNNQD